MLFVLAWVVSVAWLRGWCASVGGVLAWVTRVVNVYLCVLYFDLA